MRPTAVRSCSFVVYGQHFDGNEMHAREVALYDLGIGRLNVTELSPMWILRARLRHKRRSHRWWVAQARKEGV